MQRVSRCRPALRAGLATAILTVAPALAQTPYNASFTPSNQRGSTAATTHTDGEIDQVNVYNGALSIRIPLATIRQRGGRAQQVYLSYNSSLFELDHAYFTDTPPEGCGGRCRTDVDGNVGLREDAKGGWHLVTSDNVYFSRFVVDERHLKYTVGPDSVTFAPVGRLSLDMQRADGGGSELRWADNDDRFVDLDPTRLPAFYASFRRFRSTDSSYLRYTRHDPGLSIEGVLQFPDGARMDSTAGTFVDANGNNLRASYGGGVSVTQKREACDPIATAAGLGSSMELVTQKDAHGVDRTTTICWTDQRPRKAYRSYRFDGRGWVLETVKFEPHLRSVRWVELPNGRRFEFTYTADPGRNGWGEIATAKLPTGASIAYAFSARADSANEERLLFPRQLMKSRLESRTVSAEGRQHAWTYSPRPVTSTPGAYVVRLGKPDGNSEDHYFHGPEPTFDESQSTPPGTFPYAHNWKRGLAFRIERFAGDGESRSLMERVETLWDQNVPPGPYYAFQTNNPYERANYRTVYDPSGREAPRTSATVSALDVNGNLREATSYDWFDPSRVPRDSSGVVNGPPSADAPLISRTVHEYSTTVPYVNPSAPRILSLRTRTLVYGPGGLEAETRFEYDNYNRYALSGTPGLAGHDPAYNASHAERGNLTGESRWVNPALADGSTWSSRFHKYDVYGNRIATSDWVAGSAPFSDTNVDRWTVTAYDPEFALYPVSRTNALGHVQHSQHSRYTGHLLAETDTNGVRTEYRYDDPMSRITRVSRGDITQSRTEYADAARKKTVIGDLRSFGDGLLRAETTYDELGRQSESRSFETAGDVLVRVEYDALGEIAGRSEAYRDGETAAWTRFEHDALGRVTSTTFPDSSVTRSDFGAVSFTVTDQAGKKRRVQIDAHGRVVQVEEDPEGLAHATGYRYNGRGDLVSVLQGEQQRHFLYDSRGAIARLKHPEQEAAAALALHDPHTGNRDWSMAFAYDANGNQVRRTDARGVAMHTKYDTLGRAFEISYSDGTPTASSRYDGPIAGGLGRLWRAERAGVSRVTVEGYNANGQPLAHVVQFASGASWGAEYRASRKYNAAGLVTEETYPSGRRVEYEFGNDAQLDIVKGDLGGGARTYSSEIAYDAAGRVLRERVGTATPLWHTRRYNSRSQLIEVRLGTTDGGWNRGALRMFYTSDLGNVSGAHNNGNLYRADHFIPKDDAAADWRLVAQWYGYDSLNRLAAVAEQGYSPAGLSHELVFRHGFKYDRYGNRKVDAAQLYGSVPVADADYDSATNRVLGLGYDASGNVTRDRSSGRELELVYDAEGRLSATRGGAGSSYGYDAAGKRVRRTAEGRESWYVRGLGGNLLAEYEAGQPPAAPREEYGYGPNGLLVVANRDRGLRFLVGDQIGSPRMLADETGSLGGIERRDFLPFGEEIGRDVGVRAADAGYGRDAVRQKFTGKERDPESGLDFFEARYFSPSVGRFTTVDPLLGSGHAAEPQSWNRYAYAYNNPLVFNDPSGMDPQCSCPKPAKKRTTRKKQKGDEGPDVGFVVIGTAEFDWVESDPVVSKKADALRQAAHDAEWDRLAREDADKNGGGEFETGGSRTQGSGSSKTEERGRDTTVSGSLKGSVGTTGGAEVSGGKGADGANIGGKVNMAVTQALEGSVSTSNTRSERRSDSSNSSNSNTVNYSVSDSKQRAHEAAVRVDNMGRDFVNTTQGRRIDVSSSESGARTKVAIDAGRAADIAGKLIEYGRYHAQQEFKRFKGR